MPFWKKMRVRKYGKIKMNFFTGAAWVEYEPWEEEAMKKDRKKATLEFEKRLSESSWFKKLIEKIRSGK